MAETQDQPKVDEPKPTPKPKSKPKKSPPKSIHAKPGIYYGDIPPRQRLKS